jgi:hypothetical protein
MSALQEQNPEFKLQSHPKPTKQTKTRNQNKNQKTEKERKGETKGLLMSFPALTYYENTLFIFSKI